MRLAGSRHTIPDAGTAVTQQAPFNGRALLGVLSLLCAVRGAAHPIVQSTYLGTSKGDSVNAIAVDPRNGEIVVAGHTYSTELPGTAGGAQPHSGGGVDGFVARFDPQLKTLLHATYLGGSNGDEVTGIAIHPVTGDVYVCGFTSSTDFPGTAGGAQAEWAGDNDAFVARLDPMLGQLLGASYLGGVRQETAVALAIDPTRGSVFVTGNTDGSFPGTDGSAFPVEGTTGDGFLARFDLTLTRLVQATYVDQIGVTELVHALALDLHSGDVIVGGQSGLGDGYAGFLIRFDPSLTSSPGVRYFFEPSSNDILGVAVDPQSGDVVFTGWTHDLGLDGGAQPHPGGGPTGTDAYVLRVDPALTTILKATYLGGSENDYGYAIAIHPGNGDVYVIGQTYSADFPGTTNGAQALLVLRKEGFVARLDSTLTHIAQSTYLGAAGDDMPLAMVIHPASGEILVAGATFSEDFPKARHGAEATYAGGDVLFGGDGFVSRLTPSLLDGIHECSLQHEVPCRGERDPEPVSESHAPRVVTRPD